MNKENAHWLLGYYKSNQDAVGDWHGYLDLLVAHSQARLPGVSYISSQIYVSQDALDCNIRLH